MWMAQFIYPKQRQWIQFELGAKHKIAGMRVWNYNKAFDDSFRGVSDRTREHSTAQHSTAIG